MFGTALRHIAEGIKTLRSLASAMHDRLILARKRKYRPQPKTFAFLVHPRTDDFIGRDVYGRNDIFRPFPALAWLPKIFGLERASKMIYGFALWINPITLSNITVKLDDYTLAEGKLLSTVRTPGLLKRGLGKVTCAHLADVYRLASSKNLDRVGLGALIPGFTKYGSKLVGDTSRWAENITATRPAVSTGHAFTAYTIVDYLLELSSRRSAEDEAVRVAIMGAAGSTGKAVARMLAARWEPSRRIELVLVDLEKKKADLIALENELKATMNRACVVSTSFDPFILRSCEYIICVTSSKGLAIEPEHVSEGSVIIDDTQPRGTSPTLLGHGVIVVDVLARVNGLKVNFDFGFQTSDPTITFTCLAETALCAALGYEDDLAVGEVTLETVKRTIAIAANAKSMGLIGQLPYLTFGREMTECELGALFNPGAQTPRIAAE